MKPSVELSHMVAYIALVFFVGFVFSLVGAIVFSELVLFVRASQALLIACNSIGIGLMVFGSVTVYYAQKFRKPIYLKGTDLVCFDFYVGPYKYFRHPTYIALYFMMLGLALILNSLAMVIIASITIVVAHLTLLKKEDQFLSGECGDTYREYMKKVNL